MTIAHAQRPAADRADLRTEHARHRRCRAVHRLRAGAARRAGRGGAIARGRAARRACCPMRRCASMRSASSMPRCDYRSRASAPKASRSRDIGADARSRSRPAQAVAAHVATSRAASCRPTSRSTRAQPAGAHRLRHPPRRRRRWAGCSRGFGVEESGTTGTIKARIQMNGARRHACANRSPLRTGGSRSSCPRAPSGRATSSWPNSTSAPSCRRCSRRS